MAVSEKAKLRFLLYQGWNIEKKFESLSSWKAFITVSSPYRETLLTLVRESQQHRLHLENLMKALNFGTPFEIPTDENTENTFDLAANLMQRFCKKLQNKMR